MYSLVVGPYDIYYISLYLLVSFCLFLYTNTPPPLPTPSPLFTLLPLVVKLLVVSGSLPPELTCSGTQLTVLTCTHFLTHVHFHSQSLCNSVAWSFHWPMFAGFFLSFFVFFFHCFFFFFGLWKWSVWVQYTYKCLRLGGHEKLCLLASHAVPFPRNENWGHCVILSQQSSPSCVLYIACLMSVEFVVVCVYMCLFWEADAFIVSIRVNPDGICSPQHFPQSLAIQSYAHWQPMTLF